MRLPAIVPPNTSARHEEAPSDTAAPVRMNHHPFPYSGAARSFHCCELDTGSHDTPGGSVTRLRTIHMRPSGESAGKTAPST